MLEGTRKWFGEDKKRCGVIKRGWKAKGRGLVVIGSGLEVT